MATAILVVGLGALGNPATTQLFAALVLTCPPKMMFTMGSMHGAVTAPPAKTRTR